MIIDAHCHAWRHWPYDLTVPDEQHRGSIDALLYEMDHHGVDRATVVCARIGGGAGGIGHANPDNNDYVADFATRHPDRITAWVDVDCSWRAEYHTPGAAARLAAETERLGAGGFTHYFAGANDGWLAGPEGQEFFTVAAQRHLIASLAVGAAWFADLAAVARANPTLPILLHHLGMPQDAAETDALLGLAAEPNIGVKVSGFNYNATRHWDFPYPESLALFERLHRAFGPHRLYWGSDFPASRDQLTYTQAIEVVRQHASFLSPDDLAKIMGGNLARLLADPVVQAPATT